MCSSRTVHHQHVSVTIATIIMVNDKNVRNPKSLSKCISEQLDVTNNASNFCTGTEYQLTNYKNLIEFSFFKTI